MTNPVTGTTQAISADVSRRLAEAGVPEGKHAAKIRSLYWYAPAVVFVAGALFFSAAHGAVRWAPTVICGFVALYCASQADREGLNAAIASILTLGKGARLVVKGNGDGGAP